MRTNKTYDFVSRLLKCYSWNILTIFVAVRTNFRKCSNLRTVSVKLRKKFRSFKGQVRVSQSALCISQGAPARSTLIYARFTGGHLMAYSRNRSSVVVQSCSWHVDKDFLSMIPHPFTAALSFYNVMGGKSTYARRIIHLHLIHNFKHIPNQPFSAKCIHQPCQLKRRAQQKGKNWHVHYIERSAT